MNKPELDSPTPAQRAQFRRQAVAMADRLINAIEGKQDTFVVLEALCIVHRFTVSHLPPSLIGPVAIAMATYAGDLLQADASGKGLTFDKSSLH